MDAGRYDKVKASVPEIQYLIRLSNKALKAGVEPFLFKFFSLWIKIPSYGPGPFEMTVEPYYGMNL